MGGLGLADLVIVGADVKGAQEALRREGPDAHGNPTEHPSQRPPSTQPIKRCHVTASLTWSAPDLAFAVAAPAQGASAEFCGR